MHKIYVKDLIKEAKGELFCGDENLELTNFSKDTRQINEGDCYVGIKGENFDGNKFFMDAFEKGASCCILEKKSFDYNINKDNINKTIILVDDSIKAIQDLAHYKRNLYDIPVVAVTGSVGKTSTKDMVYSVLKEKYNCLRTEGNFNNHIGLPFTILKLKDHDALIVEMGMNHLGEISLLSKIANPTVGIITNIGTAHIGNLGSRENILKAKLEILDGMMENGTLIINNDNDLLHKNVDKIKKKVNVVTIGINNDSDYMAKNIEDLVFESNFTVDNKNVHVNAPGEVFIYNSLVGYAAGKSLKISSKNIINGINNFKLSENRLEKSKNKNGVVIINDCYNASYDSVVNSIDLISKTNNSRKILLFGDILELGDYSEDIHRKIGEYIINKDVDYTILVGNNVKYTKDELIKNGYNKENVFLFKKESDTYEFLDNFLEKGDIILIKGSHGINLINVVNYLKNQKNKSLSLKKC